MKTYTEQEVRELMRLAFDAGYKKFELVEAGLEGKETDIEINWILLKQNKK